MKTEQEIIERINHIKTLGKGWGMNERRIKELEWVLKTSKVEKLNIVDVSKSVCNHNLIPKHTRKNTDYCVCTKCGQYVKQP